MRNLYIGEDLVSDTGFRRLNEKSVRAKMIEGILSLCAYAIIILVLFYCTSKWEWPKWIIGVTMCLSLLSIPFHLYFLPKWEYRIWRYRISETSIEIIKGFLFKRKILIPMVKVQHVDAKQGPILKRYHLYTIVLSTAAGSHEIPGVSEETADEIRREIEMYARLDDEQV
jgi:membrane protein YdbS with pleckstrin-like domain